jgi:hypothetical protein
MGTTSLRSARRPGIAGRKSLRFGRANRTPSSGHPALPAGTRPRDDLWRKETRHGLVRGRGQHWRGPEHRRHGAGYYADRRQLPVVLMFMVLALVIGAAVAAVLVALS